MLIKAFLALFTTLLLSGPALAAELNVLATLPWIGSIAKDIGGDRVSVTVLVKPNQDPHHIEARPSMISAARKADIVMFNGLDLEIGYLPVIIESSRNPKIQPGNPGYLDCSRFVEAIEIDFKADRSQGDVHPLGNPHYHLSTSRMGKVGRGIAEALSALDSGNRALYMANLATFEKKLAERRKEWDGRLKGKNYVAFHRFFEYLAADLGFRITGYIEQRPGIPPSSGHMAGLVASMSREEPNALITTSYHGGKAADFLSKKTGVKTIVLPHEVGSREGIDDWFDLVDRIVHDLSGE
jgi:zinc/manganese transport system substrate-binding protein